MRELARQHQLGALERSDQLGRIGKRAESLVKQRQLAQRCEQALDRTVVDVEHHALELLLGNGQQSPAGEIAIGHWTLGRTVNSD